jgi:hypothetical protein
MAGLLFPEKLLAIEGLKVACGGANVSAIEARCTRGKAAVVGERVFELSKASEISFEPGAGGDSSSGEVGGRMVGKDDAMSVVMSATFEPLTL